MKKLITLIAIILCSFNNVLFAETPENRKENPHEIRIGIADSYMEACLENSYLTSPTAAIREYSYGPLNHT